MPDDIEGEIPVPPSMSDVVRGRAAERNAAKYERAGVISDVLLAMLTLLADHLDGFEFLETLLRDFNLWEDGIQRHKILAIQRFVADLAGGSRVRPKRFPVREGRDVQKQSCRGGDVILHRLFRSLRQVSDSKWSLGCAGVAEIGL